ncbi:MAG: hypothetical protein ACE5JP_12020 [Candidatus Bipolaricaulia bacterium]
MPNCMLISLIRFRYESHHVTASDEAEDIRVGARDGRHAIN